MMCAMQATSSHKRTCAAPPFEEQIDLIAEALINRGFLPHKKSRCDDKPKSIKAPARRQRGAKLDKEDPDKCDGNGSADKRQGGSGKRNKRHADPDADERRSASHRSLLHPDEHDIDGQHENGTIVAGPAA